MTSNKPHIKKISLNTWMCSDGEGTGIGATAVSSWLDYHLKFANY